MTDKQIIIDGVDVIGCRFYSEKLSTMKGRGSISTIKCNGFCTHNIRGLDDSSCYDAHIEYAKCKNNNCYYKQLKAENEELKKQLESTKGLVTVGNKQLAEALKENEELTSKCSQLEEENFELKEEVSIDRALFEEIDQLKKENEDLKRTNKIYEQGIARLKDEKNNLKKENNSLKETIDGLLSIQYKLADNCVKYSQTLAEIKKLAGEYIEIYFPDYYDEGTENDVVTEFANKILQKISETEDEKNM